MVQNGGFNCNVAKVLVLSSGWAQRDAFLAELRRLLSSRPTRPAYHPGAGQRYARFVASHGDVEQLGERAPGLIPPTLPIGVDARDDLLSFEEESFCSLMATTELSTANPAEFLDDAVRFCNDRLDGTLNATLIGDPKTEKEIGGALDRAVGGPPLRSDRGQCLGGGGVPARRHHVGGTSGEYPRRRAERHRLRPQRPAHRQAAEIRRAGSVLPIPQPAWSVFHRSSAETLERAARMEAAQSAAKVPGLLSSALWQ